MCRSPTFEYVRFVQDRHKRANTSHYLWGIFSGIFYSSLVVRVTSSVWLVRVTCPCDSSVWLCPWLPWTRIRSSRIPGPGPRPVLPHTSFLLFQVRLLHQVNVWFQGPFVVSDSYETAKDDGTVYELDGPSARVYDLNRVPPDPSPKI